MTQKVNPIDPDSEEADEVREEFDDSVNMQPKEIEEWLETDASKQVGQPRGSGGESVGRDSAKRIVAIKRKRASELTAEDIGHMKKVNGYVSRHLGQKPDRSGDDLAETDWAKSLKNWGHDPTK